MTHGVKAIIIPVRDLAGAKALYRTVLGVEPYADEPYYVGFRRSASTRTATTTA